MRGHALQMRASEALQMRASEGDVFRIQELAKLILFEGLYKKNLLLSQQVFVVARPRIELGTSGL